MKNRFMKMIGFGLCCWPEAGRTKIMSYFIVNEKCNGCLACVENCPASALRFEDTGKHRSLFHNMAQCARCGQCWRICPQKAIEFQHLLENQWDHVITLDLLRCAVCGEPIYTDNFSKTLQKALGERRAEEARRSGDDRLHPKVLSRPASRGVHSISRSRVSGPLSQRIVSASAQRRLQGALARRPGR